MCGKQNVEYLISASSTLFLYRQECEAAGMIIPQDVRDAQDLLMRVIHTITDYQPLPMEPEPEVEPQVIELKVRPGMTKEDAMELFNKYIEAQSNPYLKGQL